MLGLKDQAIKLFGRTIQLPPDKVDSASASNSSSNIVVDQYNSSNTATSQESKKFPEEELTDTKLEDDSSHPIADELMDLASSEKNQDLETPTAEKETSSQEDRTKETPSKTSTSQEKTLKKPDKILPCSRCNSMETKFCYYNNYNINQPRYFCKNCQRYWTAGGIMRNVPVGSGRRKNKNSFASHYRHVIASEALQIAKGLPQNPSLNSKCTVLTFGSDSSLYESMASIADKSQNYKTSNSTEKGENVVKGSELQTCQNSSPVLHFPVPSWTYPWNSDQWRPNGFSSPGFPISFYPISPYWGCAMPTTLSIPTIQPFIPQDQSIGSSSPNSPTLGKHSRDDNMVKPSNIKKETCSVKKDLKRRILIPKTLKIDDQDEARKCSVWSIGDEKNKCTNASLALQANPAAYSRSINFHETT